MVCSHSYIKIKSEVASSFIPSHRSPLDGNRCLKKVLMTSSDNLLFCEGVQQNL